MRTHINIKILLGGLLLLIGGALVLYLPVSNWLYENGHMTVITEYDNTVGQLAARQRQAQWAAAEEYNSALTGSGIKDPFIPGSGFVQPENYTELLNINGAMAYLRVPAIDISLTVYHGTSDTVLEKGIGHLEATALPTGGNGNHVVLTGHRGLTNAKLFTDLDKLVEGDIFYLHVMDEILAYKIDRILVVEPTDLEALRPIEGKDYVTLITCTPYGINSHRMLVRGIRVPYRPEEMELEATAVKKMPPWQLWLVCAGILLVSGFLAISRLVQRRRARCRNPLYVDCKRGGNA